MSMLSSLARKIERGARRNIKKAQRGIKRNTIDPVQDELKRLERRIRPEMPKMPSADEIASLLPEIDLPPQIADSEARKLSIIQRIARKRKARGASLFGGLG